MLNHTKKIKEIYEDIQRRLFYMIPEKWDKLYLYSSVIDMPDGRKTGELYFYYTPKGILKKKPVNVYEIPNKFNLDEEDYIKLVKILYDRIKNLREEFRKSETGKLWSNITITIQNAKFKVEYSYEDLNNPNDFNSYERHIIWRYEYLGIGPEQVNKKDKEILNRYLLGPKKLTKKEIYETGIYIKEVENKIEYHTDEYSQEKKPISKPKQNARNQYIPNKEYVMQKEKMLNRNRIEDIEEKNNIDNVDKKDVKTRKNQILLSKEEIEKMKENKEQ